MSKRYLYIFIIMFIFTLFVTNVNAVSQEEAINSKIDYINSEIVAISNSFATEDVDTSTSKLVNLNERLNSELTSLYQKVVLARQSNPSFSPNQIMDYPANLKAKFYEDANEKIRESYYEMQSEFKKAKFDFGLVKFKTAIAIVLNAAIVYDGALGLVGSGASGNKVASDAIKNVLRAYVVADNMSSKMKEWHGVDEIQVLKNNVDKLQEEGVKYEQYVEEFYVLKSQLLKEHYKLSRIISDINEFSDDLKYLETLIINAQNHINAASSVKIFNLDSTSFSSSQFIDALDKNLENLENEEISWSQYSYEKKKIKSDFDKIWSNIVSAGKSEENSDEHSKLYTYYYEFDKDISDTISEAFYVYSEKIKVWESALADVVEYYNSINFDDEDEINLIPMEVKYVSPSDWTNAPGQTIGTAQGRVISKGEPMKMHRIEDGKWYEIIFQQCPIVREQVDYIYGLANNAQESSGNPYDSFKAFSVLKYDVKNMNNGLNNMKEYLSYIGGLPNYLNTKLNEILKVEDKIKTLRVAYEDVKSLQEKYGKSIIADEKLCQSYISSETDLYSNLRLQNNKFTFCDTDKVINYIENELTSIKTQINDVDSICYESEDHVEDVIEKENEFIKFTMNFADDSALLVNKMEKHMDFLQTLNLLKDSEQTYSTLISYNSKELIIGNYNSLKGFYDKFNSYEDLEDFLQVQEEILELKHKMKGNLFGTSQVGFDGDFAVLDSDRENVKALLDASYYFGGYYTIENLKKGVPEIQALLDGNDIAALEGSKIDKSLNALKNDKEKLILVGNNQQAKTSFFVDAQNIWKNEILALFAENKGWKSDPDGRKSYEEAKEVFSDIADLVQDKDIEDMFSIKRYIPDESYADPIESILLELTYYQLDYAGLGQYKEKYLELQRGEYEPSKSNYDDAGFTSDDYNKLNEHYGYDDGEPVPEGSYDYENRFAWTVEWDSAFDFVDSFGASHCDRECYPCDVSCYNCESGTCRVCEDYCYECSATCFDPDFSGYDEYGNWKSTKNVDDLKEIEAIKKMNNEETVSKIREFLSYTEIGMVLPGYVPYSNEVFNFYTKDEYEIASITIENKTITDYSIETKEKYTYKIFISSATIFEDILSSSSPLDKFNEYKKSGDLVIEAKSFGGKIKTGIISFFSKIVGLFM